MISPVPELTRLTEQISKDLDFDIEIVDAFLDQGVELGKKFEQSGADVIISRGPTGVLLKKELSVPVILIQITSFDLIQALHQAQKLGRRIAFFDHVKCRDIYDFETIAEMLALEDLQLFFYSDEEDLEERIEQASRQGIEVIVGSGNCVLRMAREFGMESVMVYSSREAVIEALQRASDLVLVRQKDREKTEFLKTIIDHTYNGVVAVNKEQKVTHFNPAAEEVFNISAGKVVGKEIANMPLPFLKNFFQRPGAVKGEVHKINGKQIVFNRIPIYIDRDFLGTVITFESVNRIQNLEAAIRKKLYTEGFVARYSFEHLVGSSEAIKNTVFRARKFALSDSTVLITGESGTGKEIFAHSLHGKSHRYLGPFVAINCANIPKELLESELFGYEEGSFTGAKKGGKSGLFELAHGGTIFLDEISELPLSLQSNLLRVLQEKVVRRIGGERLIPVDVRVIAATNRLLDAEVRKGKFREDLFYRLNVLNLNIPPLRERKEDIPSLIEHFYRKFKGEGISINEFPKSVVRFLFEHDWPGNIRELENFVEKFVILSEGDNNNFRLMEELIDELENHTAGNWGNPQEEKLVENGKITINVGTIDYMEKQIIEKLYTHKEVDKKELALLLGISRTTLWKKLKEIDNPQ